MSNSNLFENIETASNVTEQIAVDCTTIQGLCELPLGNELLDAAFTREGHDLLVTANRKMVIAENYFSHEAAPTLISTTGKKIAGSSVDILTTAEVAQQYAGPVVAKNAIGAVDKLEGSVTVKRGGEEVELQAGDPVFQNDVVQTSANSKIGITFGDGSVFTLGSEARMTLDSFVYDAETGDGSSSINVIKGMFKFVSGEIAANNPGEMQVETPVATIGIRGTTGGGSVQGEGMENEFYLEPNADGTVGWFDVMTENGKTSLNQPNTIVEISSFKDIPPAPEFVPHEQLQHDFHEVIDFSPEGKYEARENAEQHDAVKEQEAVETEEAPEEENADISDETIEDTENSEDLAADSEEDLEAEKAEEAEEAPQNEEAIITTMSGEESQLNTFEQAQNTLDGVADGLSQQSKNQQTQPAEGDALYNNENAEPEGDLNFESEQTVNEIVTESYTELLNQVLSNNATSETTTTIEGEPTPPVGEEPTVDPIIEPEGEVVEEEVATPPPPAGPETHALTIGNDDFTTGSANDTFIVNNAAHLVAADIVNGGTGNDTMSFTFIGPANVSGLNNVSGIDTLQVTAASTVTIDQAFVNQSDNGVVEIDHDVLAITADLRNVDNEMGVALNGSGLVNFVTTTGEEVHQAHNLGGTSVNLDLSTNNASGNFSLLGGSNTVLGGATETYLGIDQSGGTGHNFTLSSDDNHLFMADVTGGVQSTITASGASIAHVAVLNSDNIAISSSLSNGIFTSIEDSSDVNVTSGTSDDHFEFLGNTVATVDGGGATTMDHYMFGYENVNFTGNVTLTTYGLDNVHLNNLGSGSQINITNNTAGIATYLHSDMDFNNFTSISEDGSYLYLDDGSSTTKLTLNGNPYKYMEFGFNVNTQLGIIYEHAIRDLTNGDYITTNFAGTETVFDDVITTNTTGDTVNGLDGDDRISLIDGVDNVTVQGGGGNDTIIIEDWTVDNAIINGGDGDFDILDLTGVTPTNGFGNEGVFITDNLIQYYDGGNVLTTIATIDTLGGGNDIEGYITGFRNDTITLGDGDQYINAGAGADIIDGGAGNDTLSYATSTTGVTVDLSIAVQTSAGDANGDNITLGSIENLIGSADNDNLTGDGNDNILAGGAGIDVLDGGGGANNSATYEHALISGITMSDIDGNVQNDGDGGSDTLINIQNIIGSTHDDVITISNTASFSRTFDGGHGYDTVNITDTTINLPNFVGKIQRIEEIDLSNGVGDSINLTALTAGDVQSLTGGDSHLVITSGDTGDTIDLNIAIWDEGETDGGFTTYYSGNAALAVSTDVDVSLVSV